MLDKRMFFNRTVALAAAACFTAMSVGQALA